MSSATLPSVAKWVFLKSEPDTAPPHDSQCPWHSHSSSAWQLATAYFVGLAVTIPLLPCFATQNVGQLFEYTFLYLPFLSFAHNVLSPWLSLCNPFSSRPSLYILSVCKNQCKMKMWSTLLKNHEESHNGGSRSVNQAQDPSTSGALCVSAQATLPRSRPCPQEILDSSQLHSQAVRSRPELKQALVIPPVLPHPSPCLSGLSFCHLFPPLDWGSVRTGSEGVLSLLGHSQHYSTQVRATLSTDIILAFVWHETAHARKGIKGRSHAQVQPRRDDPFFWFSYICVHVKSCRKLA